jgi:predicted DNA-binding protein YlxM (UPF0122 family)
LGSTQKQNEFDIHSCKLFSFDVISALNHIGMDGVMDAIKEREASANSNIPRLNLLSKEQNRKLKRFCKEIYNSILRQYCNAIKESGEANILSDEPIESFYMDKIAHQLGFMPSNQILLECLISESPKCYATFDMLDSKRELYIFFQDTKISSDNKHLSITIACRVRDKARKRFMGIF